MKIILYEVTLSDKIVYHFVPAQSVVSYPDGGLLTIDKRNSNDNFRTNNLKRKCMQQIEPLNYGKFYHIYNRGINSCDLFHENMNFEYFLELYDKHISPMADTFAWVLMPNHFHLLVRIKKEEIQPRTPNLTDSPDRVWNPVRAGVPAKHFSNLFNSYAQAFNKMYGRHGNLFERPFKRKEITDKEYFRNLVVYIHNNPVHHKFTEHAMDYPWSSYLTCISVKPTHLKRDAVIGWFDSKANFLAAHENPGDIIDLEKWLGL